MPAVIAAVEESMAEFDDLDNLESITKRKLALNQMMLFDAVGDICKYITIKFYQVDLISKGFKKVYTMLTEILEDEELSEDVRDKLEKVNNSSDMFA